MVDYGPLVVDGATSQQRADAAIRAYCGWHIAPVVTETLTVDGSGTSVLLLPTLHIASVASVLELGIALVDGTGYEWSVAGLLCKQQWSRWTDRPRGVVVELTHGYATVPVDLAGVSATLAGLFELAIAGGSVAAGPFSISNISGGLDGLFQRGTYEATVLETYRIPNLR